MEEKYTNKLIDEKSPYLLQHAHNPVDWYPWGEEAFEKAKAEDKPVFLSIGYSTCHWCHVMERESFENEETASFLNEHFVSIKVDREERPDIDEIYMSVCQALTGGGGWPLSIFLTPDQRPFYAGTYYPPEDRYGMPGFPSLLQAIADAWNSSRKKLIDSGDSIIEALSGREQPPGMPSADIIQRALKSYFSSFDKDYGGFGQAPKFPSPHNLLFLLRCYAAMGDGNGLQMAVSTLRAMGSGGIYDHIGGGFCRYSTDRQWLAPHFEKMLYDNALLSMAYGEAWQITKDESFALIARDTLDYILREMTDENGGFYSAEDADSEGVEGKFYLWTKEEVFAVLGQKDGTRYCELYDITERGNFESRNIPNLIGKTPPEEDRTFAEVCAKRLFDVRDKRVHPHKDDKILTSWNALMIASLALCGRVLGETQYVTAAKKAAVFLLSTLQREDGRLMERYRQGEAKYPGYADDYAFLIWALLELYDATFDSAHLQKAVVFAEDAMRLFWDGENGGLYLYGNDSEQLVMRPKSAYDGAIPSANSVFAMDCLRLSGLTGDPRWEKTAYEVLRTFGRNINDQPVAYSHLLTAYLYGQTDKADVVIVCPEDSSPDEFLSRLRSDFYPFVRTLVLWQDDETMLKTAAFLKDYRTIEGKPTAYVCTGGTCRAPATDPEEMMSELNKLHKVQKT